MKIAALMTCYNRVATTLRCLKQFVAQELPPDCQIDIYLVDDASPDQTGAKVQAWFNSIIPSHIEESSFVHLHLSSSPSSFPFSLHLIRGSGNLFWCGGMRLAWDTALASSRHYDAYLWLNDDAMLYSDAIRTILEDGNWLGWNVLVGGAFTDPQTGSLFYCATDVKKLNDVSPIESYGFLNGNLLLIPDCVCKKIGIISNVFTHQYGDYEYTVRARRMGVRCFVTRKIVGECKANYGYDKERFCALGIIDRLKKINDPKWYGLMDYCRYKYMVYGFWGAIFSFARGCLVVIAPTIFLKK